MDGLGIAIPYVHHNKRKARSMLPGNVRTQPDAKSTMSSLGMTAPSPNKTTVNDTTAVDERGI